MFPDLHQDWTPLTFRERGVAVPFTSPSLAGARVRLVERRCDLVVPHPGRARGVYIFALASLHEYGAPTLHDLRLAERLANLGAPTPGRVRIAARQIALEGSAGRAASARAAAADRADAAARAQIETVLLASALDGMAGETADPLLARAALLKLAGRTGRTPEAVKADVERLAGEIVLAGLTITRLPSAQPAVGRCEALLEGVELLGRQVGLWLAEGPGERGFGGIVAAAQATSFAGRLLLDATRKSLADPASLLSAWAEGPDQVLAKLGRLDWLLDGWEHICLVWRLAETDAARREALVEAGLTLPAFPEEAHALLTAGSVAPPAPGDRAAVLSAGAAMAGLPVEPSVLIARNERIRAMAA